MSTLEVKTQHSSYNQLVETFIQSLSHLIKEYESVIVAISSKLPSFESKIDSNIEDARFVIDMLFSGKNGDGSSQDKFEIASFHEELENALNLLRKTEEEDHKNFSDIQKAIEISTSAIKKMEAIYDISEDLKVFAINSIIYSHRAGEDGKGYQIISSEFIRLSEEIAEGSKKISDVGHQLGSLMRSLVQLFKNHEKFSRTHLEAISKNNRSFIQEAKENMVQFLDVLRDYLRNAEQIGSPTKSIMVQLQRQDIIHQQLTHVSGILEDISVLLKEHENMIFRDDVKNIPSSEQEDFIAINTLFHFLIVTIDKQSNRLTADMLELNEDLSFYFKQMGENFRDSSGCLDLADLNCDYLTLIRNIFSSPEEIINSIKDSIKTSTDQKKNIVGYFDQIEKKVLTEKQYSLEFLPVVEAINNLLLLAKIEQARYKLEITTKSDYDILKLTSGNFNELTEIVSEFDHFSELIGEKLETTTQALELQQDNYDEVIQKMKALSSILKENERVVVTNIHQIDDHSNELIEEIESFMGGFEHLRNSVSNLSKKKDKFLELGVMISQNLDPYGGPIPLDQCNFHSSIIQNIVEKCTVDDERITLQEEFSELTIEKGGGNDVTLF